MRTVAALVALLALPALPAAAAQAPATPPGDLVVFPGTGNLTTTFFLDASRGCCLAGGNVVPNGGFDAGLSGWSLGGQRAGRIATVARFEEGHGLVARTEWSNHNDSTNVALTRRVPLTGAPTYVVGFDATSHGTPLNWSIVLAETGYRPGPDNATTWNTTLRGTLPRDWTRVEVPWAPRHADATEVTVAFRFLATPGSTASVGLDNLTLQPGASFAWSFDPDAVANVTGATASVTFGFPGDREVRVRIVNTTGASWNRTAVVRVRSDAPTAAVHGPTQVVAGGVGEFEATGLTDPDERPLLRNPSLATMDGWSAAFASVGGNGTAAAAEADGERGVRIAATATRAGGMYLAQAFPIVHEGEHTLRARYRDSGNLSHQWILRESGGPEPRETFLRPPRSPDAWSLAELNWTPAPGSKAGELLLRVLLAANESGEAWFRDVDVAPALRHAWDVDGDGGTDATGRRVALPFRTPGRVEAALVTTDRFGARSVTPFAVEVVPPVLEAAVSGPGVVVLGEEARYRAEAWTRGGNLLADPALARASAWNLTAAATTLASWGADGGLRLRVNGGERGHSLTLSQTVPLEPRATYRFEVDERDGGVVRYEHVLREVGPRSALEAILRTPAAPEGNRTVMTWTPTLPDARQALVTLRIVVPPNATDVVHVRAPSLTLVAPAPGPTFTWTAPGTPDGATLAAAFDAPGVRDVAVRAEDQGRVAEARTTVLVLERAPRLHASIGGSVVVTLPDGVEGLLAWGPENGTKRLYAAAPVRELPAPPAGGEAYALVLHAGEERGFLLARVKAEDAATRPIPGVDLSTRLPSPLTGILVRASVPDASAREVAATLLDASGAEVARAVLAPVEPGVYEGRLPVRGARLLADHAVTVTATDEAGRRASVVAASGVRVTPLANLDLVAPPVLGFLLVCVMGAAVGVARARRGA